MGESGGFLKYKRENAPYRPVEVRIHDFNAVEMRLPVPSIRLQSARCMACGTPFCHATGCPLGNVIPELNDLVYRGRWKEALDLLLMTNNFPEFTGRICPALCEASCVLGINDEPVSIRQIELTIIEEAFNRDLFQPRIPETRLPFSVAVIGSGPAGLAVADDLNQAGVHVTVYEKDLHPGGILRYGIPDFKLEKWILDRRINLMTKEGVKFETNVVIGQDISLEFLKRRFDAICLAIGSREPRDLKIPGREAVGICFAMDYLRQQNRKLANEEGNYDLELEATNKNVVVIGGGDTGADCLGTAIRQGAKQVIQIEILPEPPRQRPPSTPWPQWPNILRESSSHKEGGTRIWSVRTEEFITQNGHVKGLRCVRLSWEKQGNNPPSPVPIPGSEFTLDADLVILAMGFIGPKGSKLIDDLGIRRNERNVIVVDQRSMTNIEGIFAAGDSSLGQSLVVRAIADGKRAAKGILEYLFEKKSKSK